MSQYIPSFLIEPVVRHARRFSGRSANNDHQPPPSETQNDVVHDHRVGAVDSHALGLQEGDHAIGLDASRSNYTTSAEDEVTFQLPENESGEDSHTWATLRRSSNVVTRQSEYSEEEAIADSRGSVSSAEGTLNSFLRNTPLSSDLSPQSMTENSGNSDEPTETRDQGMTWDLENYRSLGNSLPADDGMSLLRKRILAIQCTSSSSTEKALRVHRLMTEQSISSKATLEEPRSAHSSFQSSLSNDPRSPTQSPASSMESKILSTLPPASHSVIPQGVNLFDLSSSDLQPTYYHEASHDVDSESMQTMGSSGQSSKEYEGSLRPLGCPHYRRNIKLKCSICGRWYTCRFCHDSAEDHSLKRRETKYMLCMLCGSAQAASGNCINCGEPSARYYCDVCKLWDDDPAKSIYHCYDCGICRVGQGLGKDFYHCKTCSVCLSISIRDTHRCIERSTDCDCPICGEYMFTSPQTVVFMRCGHSIHHQCYYEHMRNSYRCPICSRSIVNMEMQFRHLERAIESQPMPPQFQDTKAWIFCNDCNAKSTVKYHWLGFKCALCDSYNTAQLQILSSPTIGPASPGTINSPLNLEVLNPGLTRRLDPNSRARRTDSGTHLHRSRYSVSAIPDNADSHDRARRSFQSQSPHYPGQRSSNWRPSSSSDGSDSKETDDDEDYDDVDFWGGDDLNRRLGALALDEDARTIETSEEDEETDNDDQDPDNEDDEDYEDEMEVFGHV